MERNHFLLRRLHSLSGIVPVGVFLVEHLYTNALAFLGAHQFNEHVRWIHGLPFLPVIELLFIFLPLAFHAGYGIVIARTGESNVRQYPWLDNWRYTLQRVTGWIAVFFILVHLGHFRFAHWLGGPTYLGSPDPFAMTQLGFARVFPFEVWAAFYAVGVLASVFHFCNGICTFCITWGITIGDRSRRRVSVGAAGLGVVLASFGLLSLVGLRVNPPAGQADHRHIARSASAAPAEESGGVAQRTGREGP